MQIRPKNVKPGSSYESLLLTLGFIVVQWGHCEQTLEIFVNTIIDDYSVVASLKRKRAPRQITDKLKFLTDSAYQIEALSEFRSDLAAVVTNFESLKQVRHNLIHGGLASPIAINSTYKFIRLDTLHTTPEVVYFDHDLKTFPALEARLMSLGDDILALAQRIKVNMNSHIFP